MAKDEIRFAKRLEVPLDTSIKLISTPHKNTYQFARKSKAKFGGGDSIVTPTLLQWDSPKVVILKKFPKELITY